MEVVGTLELLAELSIAVLGFSGVVAVLGRRASGDWTDLVQAFESSRKIGWTSADNLGGNYAASGTRSCRSHARSLGGQLPGWGGRRYGRHLLPAHDPRGRSSPVCTRDAQPRDAHRCDPRK